MDNEFQSPKTSFQQKLPYDAAALKRRGYNGPGLKGKNFFGKLGIAQGRQGAEPTDPSNKPGDTQIHNRQSMGSHNTVNVSGGSAAPYTKTKGF